VGPSYFIEIAKLRAARLLWARRECVRAGLTTALCLMRLNVRTPRRNKRPMTGITNLLRVTTEALSAVMEAATN